MVASLARVGNDPDRYVRPVKGGRYQARPYCGVEHRRYDLGCFETREQARKAVREFWWGKRKALLPGTRRFRLRDGRVCYAAVAVVLGERVSLKRMFDTREEAHRALLDAVAEKLRTWPLVCWLVLASLSES